MYYPIYLSQYFYEVVATAILFLDKKIHIWRDIAPMFKHCASYCNILINSIPFIECTLINTLINIYDLYPIYLYMYTYTCIYIHVYTPFVYFKEFGVNLISKNKLLNSSLRSPFLYH